MEYCQRRIRFPVCFQLLIRVQRFIMRNVAIQGRCLSIGTWSVHGWYQQVDCTTTRHIKRRLHSVHKAVQVLNVLRTPICNSKVCRSSGFSRKPSRRTTLPTLAYNGGCTHCWSVPANFSGGASHMFLARKARRITSLVRCVVSVNSVNFSILEGSICFLSVHSASYFTLFAATRQTR